jgi:hypothetical protein
MNDPGLNLETLGRDYFGDVKERAAKQTVLRERLPHYFVNGHMLVLKSVADAWRESRTMQPVVPTLKSMLDQIADRVLQENQ